MKEMVRIPRCYTEEAIEVRAINVTMPFSDMVRPFAGPERSQVNTTTRIEGVTCGKESTISTLAIIKLSFNINDLSRGGWGVRPLTWVRC